METVIRVVFVYIFVWACFRLLGKRERLVHAARFAQPQGREGGEEPIAKRASHLVVLLDQEQ